MKYNFDEVIDRAESDSIKWHYYASDVLPLWVADMDFRSPEAVSRTIIERAQHDVFGYPMEVEGLSEAIMAWLEHRFNWRVKKEDLIFLPGVVVGFNLVTQALVEPGQNFAYQMPVYMPFLEVAKNGEIEERTTQLECDAEGRYSLDWDLFESSLDERSKMYLLCSPHNPVGRVWQRWELERMVEICLRKGLTICSDEIHADLVYQPNCHIPIASIDPEVAQKTVTLLAPSKTFNIPGLGFSYAVVPNVEIRKRIVQAQRGLVSHPNLLGMVGAVAAYREGEDWLEQLLVYLRGNRDFLCDWLARELPEVKCWAPEGTYLAWLDCRGVGTGEKSAMKFILERGKVALSDGAAFGKGGDGYVRLNFGCPRTTLVEGLRRIKNALRGGETAQA
jgi:cystathionine beta-lyase